MDIFICSVYLAAVIFLFYKLLKRNSKEDKAESMEFFSIAEKIEYLNEIKEQLKILEEMITDIELCSSEYEKPIKCEWTDSAGKNSSYTLWIDGGKTAELMLKTMYAERKKLRSSLLSGVKDLSDRCNENCNDNYVISGRGEQ